MQTPSPRPEFPSRSEEGELSMAKRVFNFLCGIDSSETKMQVTEEAAKTAAAPKKTKEDEAREAAEFLEEEPFWKNFADFNAVLVATVTVFILGFFA